MTTRTDLLTLNAEAERRRDWCLIADRVRDLTDAELTEAIHGWLDEERDCREHDSPRHLSTLDQSLICRAVERMLRRSTDGSVKR